jgi:plastocyanin
MSNTTIQLRHSTETGNVPVSLANGEIAVNSQDGKLFYADPTGTVQEFSLYPGPSGLDTEIQFNDSGVLGSSANLSFNKTTNVLSTKNIIVSGNSYFGNANLHEGITQLSVTNDGASAYLFDQYAGSNPSLYVGAGQTISFNLNVSGHPFVIRESSGGANTSDGLTHISNTGVVTTGADAQGKVSGVLFWKVPFSLVGSTYVYQCTIHGGMVGNIVIQQPASFVAANTTLAFNTANAAFDNSNTKFNSSGGTISGNVFITGGLFPSVDNTGVVGNSAFTWNDGQFTDLTVNNILNVRAAIDLADGDKLRFGTNDDWQIYHDGTANRMDLFTRDLTIRDDNTTRFTFGRTTGNFTANGDVTATNFLVGSLNVNEHVEQAYTHANAAFDAANTSVGGNSFGVIFTSNNSIFANAVISNDQVTFTGVNGVSVEANATTKVITFAGTPGAQGLTVDYGFVTESIVYSLDYGTL